MYRTVEIPRADRPPCRIAVGSALENLPDFLPDAHTVIITDSNLHRLYGDLIGRYDHIVIGMGETNKTLHTVERIYRDLLRMGAGRKTFVIGFGGGIVTDITGFAASTFMRGLPFGFIATSLLAQVDAAIGGKNGVNIEGYKNMAGTFTQPEFVLCDPSLLKTLPRKEFIAASAEIIKAAVIGDPDLFQLLSTNNINALMNNGDLLSQVIDASIRVKTGIVIRDEMEKGERRLLNLGHTFGHAMEKCNPAVVHGEAVGAGIALAARMAEKIGACSSETRRDIISVLDRYALPVNPLCDTKRIIKAVSADKKKNRETIDIILPSEIGNCIIKSLAIEDLPILIS